jgi:hypothetical protein
MNVKFKFPNGHVGVLTEEVAEVLEGRGQGEILDLAEGELKFDGNNDLPRVGKAAKK